MTKTGQNEWQGQRDSNPRPAVLETAALPTELYPYDAIPIRYQKTRVKYQTRNDPIRFIPDSNPVRIGAGEGNRTLVISLEGCCSTIELHPRR